MVFDSIGMVTSAATIYMLRRRPTEGEIYKIGFGKNLMPAIFILVYTATALSALLSAPQNIPISIGLFLAGLPLYYIIKKLLPKP